MDLDFSVTSCLPKIYRHGSKPFPNHRLRRAVSNRFPCLSGPMNPQPAAALTRPQSSAGSIGNAAPLSTTASPTSVKGKRSRKRESSSASDQDGYEGNFGDKRRQPGVKRACNECRQQKVGWASVARSEKLAQLMSQRLATVRRRYGTGLHDMCSMSAPEPGMQD